MEPEILDTQNPVLHFVKSALYFISKVLHYIIFFSKVFFRELWNNIVLQVRKSIESYVFAGLIATAFLVPLLIRTLSMTFFVHLRESRPAFPDANQFMIIGYTAILVFMPLMLVRVLRLANGAIGPQWLKKKDREELYVSILVSGCALEVSTGIELIFEHILSYYLVIFVAIICTAIAWAILNTRRQGSTSYKNKI